MVSSFIQYEGIGKRMWMGVSLFYLAKSFMQLEYMIIWCKIQVIIHSFGQFMCYFEKYLYTDLYIVILVHYFFLYSFFHEWNNFKGVSITGFNYWLGYFYQFPEFLWKYFFLVLKWILCNNYHFLAASLFYNWYKSVCWSIILLSL